MHGGAAAARGGGSRGVRLPGHIAEECVHCGAQAGVASRQREGRRQQHVSSTDCKCTADVASVRQRGGRDKQVASGSAAARPGCTTESTVRWGDTLVLTAMPAVPKAGARRGATTRSQPQCHRRRLQPRLPDCRLADRAEPPGRARRDRGRRRRSGDPTEESSVACTVRHGTARLPSRTVRRGSGTAYVHAWPGPRRGRYTRRVATIADDANEKNRDRDDDISGMCDAESGARYYFNLSILD